MKLWIFGHSACQPYMLGDDSRFWGRQLAKRLTCDQIINRAQAASDNLYIYHTILQEHRAISQDDFVVVGWSHPSRKTFVMEKKLSADLENHCMIYPGRPAFFRSAYRGNNNQQKWAVMTPSNKGVAFFDQWFETYFSRTEADINFQAYIDSARGLIAGRYLPFYFSQESISNLLVSGFCWLDWIIENRCWMSESDLHPDMTGHDLLTDVFHDLLDHDR